ncbi:MAG: CHRD domain-containing protein [Novosphingobium sp.]
MLSGAQEVGAGDPDGAATAEVTVSGDERTLCYAVHDIGPITGAHIHRGVAGKDGPHLIPFARAPEGGLKGCVAAPAWLDDAMKTGLTGYYINIHTAEYPAGAIRGQLGQ